jgi:hypothetical protein
MKILTAHQPAYLPWLGLFHKIGLADVYVYMDDVKYSKSDFSNRNKIRFKENDTRWLTIPVKTKGSDQVLFTDLKIDNSQKWKTKHIAWIHEAYRKCPYFNHYFNKIKELLSHNYEYLVDLNFALLEYFLGELAIKAQLVKAGDLNMDTSGNDYLIDLCRKMDCSVYIFGSLGVDYANQEKFNACGIKIYCQNYKHPTYKQSSHESFIANLSVLDLIFNHGPKSGKILAEGNIDRESLITQNQ